MAVSDGGIYHHKDFQVDPTKGNPDSRILEKLSFNPDSTGTPDRYGHGTHVAGIIGSSGYISGERYAGVAPKANLISLKISDEMGMAYESDTVDAMRLELLQPTTRSSSLLAPAMSVEHPTVTMIKLLRLRHMGTPPMGPGSRRSSPLARILSATSHHLHLGTRTIRRGGI